MPSSGCRAVCKLILIVFSLLCFLVGTIPLTLGLWIINKDKTRGIQGLAGYDSWSFLTEFSMILIALGSVLILAAVSGLYGGSSGKKWALNAFSMFGLLLVFGGVGFGCLALFMKDRVGVFVVRAYVEIYGLYVFEGTDSVLEFLLRNIHNVFHCCGVTGIPLMEGTCPSPTQFLERIVMPNCPLTIALHFDQKAPFTMAFFSITALLWVIPMSCCHIITKKQNLTLSPPQYVSLTNMAPPLTAAPVWAPPPALTQAPPLANPPLYTQANVAPPWSFPDQDPADMELLDVDDPSAPKGLA